MTQNPLPAPLPPEVLTRRDSLPLKPAPVTLTGRYVRLEPLVVERDAPALFEISNGSAITWGERAVAAYDADALIWRYMLDGPFNSLVDMKASLQASVDASNGLCLCVFDLASGRPVGVTNYM